MRTDRAHAVSAGRVSRLWRYPVKSMLGEELESSEVVSSGLFGSRSYALIDVESSLLVSAKAPTKWGKMLECRSRLLGDGAVTFPPPVQIVLPGGKRIDASDRDSGPAEAALSTLLGRRVKLVSARAGSGPLSIEQYHPKIEEDPDSGDTLLYPRGTDAQAGTFADLAAVHLVTTSSLDALSGVLPSAAFDPARFRPDLLVDTGGSEGFAESGWTGKTLEIGDEVRLKVFKECGRCVMTTLPQHRLPPDTGVLQTIMRHNKGKLGVYASVVEGGKVRPGDSVRVS